MKTMTDDDDDDDLGDNKDGDYAQGPYVVLRFQINDGCLPDGGYTAGLWWRHGGLHLTRHHGHHGGHHTGLLGPGTGH